MLICHSLARAALAAEPSRSYFVTVYTNCLKRKECQGFNAVLQEVLLGVLPGRVDAFAKTLLKAASAPSQMHVV